MTLVQHFSPLIILSFSLFLLPALVERKRELAAKQEAADLERKKVMELEEALKDSSKRRGVPREVILHLSKYHIN